MRLTVARHLAAPFEWGVNDCSLAFEAVLAMTGFDAIEAVRGYDSPQEAMRRLRAAGYRSVLELVEASFPEISPAHAQRGDLGYIDSVEPLMSPAIIDGAVAHSKALAGPVLIPRGQIVRAFAV